LTRTSSDHKQIGKTRSAELEQGSVVGRGVVRTRVAQDDFGELAGVTVSAPDACPARERERLGVPDSDEGPPACPEELMPESGKPRGITKHEQDVRAVRVERAVGDVGNAVTPRLQQRIYRMPPAAMNRQRPLVNEDRSRRHENGAERVVVAGSLP
jgi:hypothetical protein